MRCNSICQKSNLLLSPSIFLSPQNVHRTVHTRIDVCIVLHTIYEPSLPCMRAKSGKILPPDGTGIPYSPSTLAVGERKRSGCMMNLAIRGGSR